MQNLTKLQERIRASTGYTATITRFPGGSSNTISKKYNEKHREERKEYTGIQSIVQTHADHAG